MLQIIPNSKMKIWSNCCKKPVKLGGDGETNFYVCTSCNKACDMEGTIVPNNAEKHGEDGRVEKCNCKQKDCAMCGWCRSGFDCQDGRVEKRWTERCAFSDHNGMCTCINGHNKQPIVNQSWEERFDREWGDGCINPDSLETSKFYIQVEKEYLKSFISQLLIDQKREWVEKIKKLENPYKYPKGAYFEEVIDKMLKQLEE